MILKSAKKGFIVGQWVYRLNESLSPHQILEISTVDGYDGNTIVAKKEGAKPLTDLETNFMSLDEFAQRLERRIVFLKENHPK